MPPPDSDGARSFCLTSATGLVVGSIVGTGVFTMPGVLAGAGTSSILLGIPIYAFLKARRERRGDVAEPVELPEADTDVFAPPTPGAVQHSSP